MTRGNSKNRMPSTASPTLYCSSTVRRAPETTAQTATAVGDAASETFDTIKGAVPDIKRAERPETEGFGGVLQNNLKETFERQPLLLGAIGLAIGAGMAAAVPSTEMERDFAGDTAAKLTADAKEFAGTQVDKAKAVASRTLEAVKDESEEQGLTADAAKEGRRGHATLYRGCAADIRTKFRRRSGIAECGRSHHEGWPGGAGFLT